MGHEKRSVMRCCLSVRQRTELSIACAYPVRNVECDGPNCEEKLMSLGTILLIVLILMLIGAIPTWPHSRSWGYGPTGGLGLVVLVVIVLLLLGRL